MAQRLLEFLLIANEEQMAFIDTHFTDSTLSENIKTLSNDIGKLTRKIKTLGTEKERLFHSALLANAEAEEQIHADDLSRSERFEILSQLQFQGGIQVNEDLLRVINRRNNKIKDIITLLVTLGQ